MRKTTLSLQFIALVLVFVPAYAGQPADGLSSFASGAVPASDNEYADGWSIASGEYVTKIDSWKLFISISVLDGQSTNIAKLFRSHISQATTPTVRPKPRPRLGASRTNIEDHPVEAQMSTAPHSGGPNPEGGSKWMYSAQVEEVSRFLGAEAHRFVEQWNAPLEPSESLQWVHVIEAECVMVVNKRNGAITIESLSDSPNSEGMEKLRNIMLSENGVISGEAKPAPSDPAELNRLRKFVISRSAMTVPDALTSLPGEVLRIRLSLKVAGFNEETNSYAPSAAGFKHTSAKPPGSSTPFPDTTGGRQTDSTHIVRTNSQENIDVEDPKFHLKIGFKYLNGDGLKRDYAMALYHFQSAAEKGNTSAQFQLGYMYQRGTGVERDPAKAFAWYLRAADQGDALAIYNISCMYQNGDGMKRDPTEAAKWIRKAADLGSAVAQWSLGIRYADGEGVGRDPAEAFNWSLRAAKQDYANAQFTVGQMYEEGLGVAKDEIEALAWYNLSPTSGLSDKINFRDRLEQRLGPQAAATARERAEDLRKRMQKKETTPSG